jgi:N-acetyltransferase
VQKGADELRAMRKIGLNDGKLGPCSLEGDHVLLEPLRIHHSIALFEAAKDTDWTWSLVPLRSRADVEKRIQNTLDLEKRDEAYAFAVSLKKTKRVIGSTSYFLIVSKHKRAEVGFTWYTRDVWGTFVNPECKYLLLKHAFEDWHAVRIQLGTDINNLHSQRAIQKLGAQYEGTLRNHGIRPDGSLRDSKLYSIISSEWPNVKTKLLSRINASNEYSARAKHRKPVVESKA